MALTPVPINATTVPGGASIQTDQIGGDSYEVVKQAFGEEGVATMVSAADPLPTTDAAVLAKLSADPATQTTLAALLAKVIAAPSTEAKQDIANGFLNSIAAIVQPLTDTQLRATPVPVSGTVTVNTSLLSTAAKQDSQTELLTTLNSLIENLNSLVNVLLPLGSAMNSGAPGLRVTPNAATLPISGSVTATVASTVVSSLTNFGTGIPAKEMADDINNLIVTMANINNVTV